MSPFPTLLALAALLLTPAVNSQPAQGLENFITRRGDKLFDGETELRFVSVNAPDILQTISNYQFDGDYATTRFRLPNEYEQRDCVRSVRQMGGSVIRTFMITSRSEDSPMHMFNVAENPVVGNEEAIRVLDKLLQICNEEGVRLIIPLIAYKSSLRGDPSTYGDDFWQIGSEANLKFKNMVTQIVNRTNHYTGLPYLEDRAILGWHTGNELVIGNDPERRAWLHDFAAFLKSVDPNHLVIDGRNRPADVYNQYAEFLDDPNIDAVSYHTYVNLPEADTPAGTLRLISEQTRGKMPLIVTEVAMYTSPSALRSLLDEVIASGSVGAQWWGLRFHNRDGGFYKHSDRNSEFEDLNWPGFESPNHLPETIARERELLQILNEYGWKIQGLPKPPPTIPEPPTLLPIPDTSHISWQGSTGANAYRLQRAEAENGPWSDIATDLNEHLISYAAQYCDRNAQPNQSYFYRIFARNKAGESTASNTVGPISAEKLWLVDELFDLKSAAPESRNLRIDQAYAHTDYLEDIALAIRANPKEDAELIYRFPQPIRSFTATVYHAEITPRIFVIEADNSRREIQPVIASYDAGKRRRLSANLNGDSKGIVIELSQRAAEDQAIGRVEISTQAPR